MKKNILVRVKNTFNPDHPGPASSRDERDDSRVVKAITYIEKVAADQYQRCPDDRETRCREGNILCACGQRGERDDDLPGIIGGEHLADHR